MQTFSPVTFLSENEDGDIGTEMHEVMTSAEIEARIAELSDLGWEVSEVQVNESQYTWRGDE